MSDHVCAAHGKSDVEVRIAAAEARGRQRGHTEAINADQPYCATCGEALPRCPDCGKRFCGYGDLVQHTELGTCPDRADGWVPGDPLYPENVTSDAEGDTEDVIRFRLRVARLEGFREGQLAGHTEMIEALRNDAAYVEWVRAGQRNGTLLFRSQYGSGDVMWAADYLTSVARSLDLEHTTPGETGGET